MSSQSPGKAHSSTASPYSAIMRSPLSPFNQSPIISSSAGNSSSASPAGTIRPHQGSPSTCFSKAMTTLTNLQLITPRHFTKPNPPFQISRRVAWRIHDGGKGFSSSSPKGGARKSNTPTNKENRGGAGAGGDDKIPDVVWERMVPRILSYVGVPLAVGFALLKGFDVAIDNGTWNVPKWLPFVTTFITFGASALGIAYGSLSTSLDAEEEGSLLGFEQVQKNWVEMWEEEDAA